MDRYDYASRRFPTPDDMAGLKDGKRSENIEIFAGRFSWDDVNRAIYLGLLAVARRKTKKMHVFNTKPQQLRTTGDRFLGYIDTVKLIAGERVVALETSNLSSN